MNYFDSLVYLWADVKCNTFHVKLLFGPLLEKFGLLFNSASVHSDGKVLMIFLKQCTKAGLFLSIFVPITFRVTRLGEI